MSSQKHPFIRQKTNYFVCSRKNLYKIFKDIVLKAISIIQKKRNGLLLKKDYKEELILSLLPGSHKQSKVFNRDCYLIGSITRNFDGFNDFLIINGISELSLISASDEFLYKIYKKGEFLYRKKDSPSSFYIIIKGNIMLNIEHDNYYEDDNYYNSKEKSKSESVYKRKLGIVNQNKQKIINIYKKRRESKVKTVKLTDGDIFGEEYVLYNKHANADALACSDSHVICIEREVYMLYFKNEVMMKEKEKRLFLMGIFPEIGEMSQKNKEVMFRKMKYRRIRLRGVVYNQGDEADRMYVVLNGECEVYSKYKNLYKSSDFNFESPENILLKKVRKGFVIGMEGLEEIYKEVNDESEVINGKYLNSLISSNNETIVISIKITDVKNMCYRLGKRLLVLYKKQKEEMEIEFQEKKDFKVRLKYNDHVLKERLNIKENFMKNNEKIVYDYMSISRKKVNTIDFMRRVSLPYANEKDTRQSWKVHGKSLVYNEIDDGNESVKRIKKGVSKYKGYEVNDISYIKRHIFDLKKGIIGSQYNKVGVSSGMFSLPLYSSLIMEKNVSYKDYIFIILHNKPNNRLVNS